MDIKYPEIDLSKKKGILIDLDNTLYHYASNHRGAMKACYPMVEEWFPTLAAFEDQYRYYRNQVTNRLKPTGACRSRLHAFIALAEALNTPSKYSLIGLVRHILEFFFTNMTLAPAAKSFLDRAHSLRLPVAIVSDMLTAIQIKKICALKIEPLISFLITSEEVGVEKPNPRIFEVALEKLGLTAGQVIMIGDHQEKDILGSQKLGITAYRVIPEC